MNQKIARGLRLSLLDSFTKHAYCRADACLLPLITPLQPTDQEMATATEIQAEFKKNEPVFDQPFVTPKPVLHSPKISPSSIPNPSPSVTINKQIDSGYPNYGGYLYSIPGYSAFQPIYPGAQTSQPPAPTTSVDNNFQIKNTEQALEDKTETSPEVDAVPSISEVKADSKMSIMSLSQGSGATVTIPVQNPTMDVKKKPERFSLKTSIPISKIDMKCVNSQPEIFHKKPTVFNPAFAKTETSRVEIQSNIIIKPPVNEPETKDQKTLIQNESKPVNNNNNINTLLNAAEAINKNDNLFRMPEPKIEENNESKEVIPPVKSIFNTVNIDNKVLHPNKPMDATHSDQKNQFLFIQNKNTNPKMLLTIQQQNPQVLLQRTNFDSKNLQAPSRLSNQSKKIKDDESSTSKVVALKRCHQENCDENDFENLITENQIYGNKIVVKEKLQGTQQEQDLKNKKVDKQSTETKNVVLQPNILYLSNVQFPTNLLMIKNNNKISNEAKGTNENKFAEVTTSTNEAAQLKSKADNSEQNVLTSNNNVLQTAANKGKTDLLVQTNPKVIVNSHMVYQVPMILNTDNKDKTQSVREYPKIMGQKKELSKQFDQKNDKLFIACPYQVDSKLQPKIVITNIRPKITKELELSSMDIYEKRRRLRRLKHLANNVKETKSEKKVPTSIKYTITPEKMPFEIYKEFANYKLKLFDDATDSESDYDADVKEYDNIQREFGSSAESEKGKLEFLATLKLATRDVIKADKQLEIQERLLKRDSVASSVDRSENVNITSSSVERLMPENVKKENAVTLQKKQVFLSQLRLIAVSRKYKVEYEKIWREVLKERNRRNGVMNKDDALNEPKLDIDTVDQLKMLTEIKEFVTENNNLIKRRLDSSCGNENEESINALAEKNFSELNRLSKMAGRSVKLFSGKEMKKRDLNPGFDSENIQKDFGKPDCIITNTDLNVPNVSKIISLKSVQDTTVLTITPATSMDEPRSSAAGVVYKREEISTTADRMKTVGCQAEESWLSVEAIMKSYRDYDAARKKEIADLQRRNTALRIECAHVTRFASRESDRARALLAERQNLAVEENNLILSVQRLCNAIKVIRES